ncbi:MAG: quinolinate synthase [Acidobacteriota bacterium]
MSTAQKSVSDGRVTDFASYVNGLPADLAVEAEVKRDMIEEILELKAAKDVLILGHNYMSPLVYNLSDRDCRGDSLALSLKAARTSRPIILFNGVGFMAETAKILNPDKTVLLADRHSGCSLAAGLTRDDVRTMKAAFPGVPVVAYINSTAAVKAESDICCTSANGLDVVRSTGADRVIFIPDSLMGENLQQEIDRQDLGIDLIYPGKSGLVNRTQCEVHEQISVEDIRNIRIGHDIPKNHPRRAVLVHWECHPAVVEEADFCGSTSQMARYIAERRPERVFLGTECEMAANLRTEFPQTEFVRLCNVFCRHMALIRLDKILAALRTQDPEYEVIIDDSLRRRALQPIRKMLALAA